MTSNRRSPNSSWELTQPTPFSSQPASVTSTALVELFWTANCRKVAGSPESAEFKGMKGEKASQGHAHRQGGDRGTRPCRGGTRPEKANAGKTFAIQTADENLLAALHPQGEALAERRIDGAIVVALFAEASLDVLVEEVPMDQAAVAGQIELTRADAADGHTDRLQVRALVPGTFALGHQELQPLGL